VARKTKRRSDCPINFALEIFGDRWSLLIIRDLLFRGRRTYGEFRDAGEGIATNILADRLEKLETAGLITRQPDPENGTRYLYSLRERGLDLLPVMLEIIAWSGKHDPDTAVPREFRDSIAKQRQKVIRKIRRQFETRL
jgi:DNA-binding HxlR family transcriptional regulator